jgi:hypothetical protein
MTGAGLVPTQSYFRTLELVHELDIERYLHFRKGEDHRHLYLDDENPEEVYFSNWDLEKSTWYEHVDNINLIVPVQRILADLLNQGYERIHL